MTQSTTITGGGMVVDKPTGVTSHDVVYQLRRALQVKQVGHAGTLDPFASGVLLMLIGTSTRLMPYLTNWQKTYQAVITLGGTSDTDDATGVVTATLNAADPGRAMIDEAVQQFTGSFLQQPPRYAAIKHKGRKLYQYARAGEEVTVPPRPVTILALKVTSYQYPTLAIDVTCSSGTYIRSLGRDIGAQVGTGGYVSQLRRTAVGPFDISKSIQLDKESAAGDLLPRLIPPRDLLAHLPAIQLPDESVAKLKDGGALVREDQLPADTPIALQTAAGAVFGVGFYDPTTLLLSPRTIIER